MMTKSTYSGEAVAGLELFSIFDGIVDESKSGGLSTTVLGTESENKDGGLVLDFVHL